MLQVKDLNVGYGAINVLHDFNMEVKQGEVVALIGANGAGKTTLLRAISGLLRPRSGAVVFGDKSIAKLRPYEIVRLGMSHVPERRGIFANLTVFENLRMGAYTRKATNAEYDEVYAIFPRLAERKKQIAGTLSGGEQQMLAISRALLARPKLMLLDEPSLGLAPQITRSIFSTVRKINEQGTTILLVEQNARAALSIAHRGYCLEVGRIIFSDEASKLLENDIIRKAYLGEV